MNELLLYWLLPSLAVWVVFRAMVLHDGLSLTEPAPRTLGMTVMLSVIWPAGAIVLAGIVIDAGFRRWVR